MVSLDINRLFEDIVKIFACVYWIAGFVIAEGFWCTLFCIIPFYSWYLCIEYFIVIPFKI